MARRRKSPPDFENPPGTFDTRFGEYRDVAGQGGRVGPSVYPPRSEAELLALRRVLGVENPGEGITTRPEIGDVLSSALTRAIHRPENGSSPDGWGHWVYGVKTVGKGKNKVQVLRSVPWKVIGIIGGVLLAGYALERVFVGIASWWPGSSLNVSSWDKAFSPAPLTLWLSQHLQLTAVQDSVSIVTGAPTLAQQAAAAASQAAQSGVAGSAAGAAKSVVPSVVSSAQAGGSSPASIVTEIFKLWNTKA